LGIALSVAETELCKSVLVFGVSGNGKSSFIPILTKDLYDSHGKNFRLFKVICDKVPIGTSRTEKLRQVFKTVFEVLDSIKEPKILLFDEIDGIVPHAAKVNPEWRAFIYYLRACLRSEPKNVLVVGTTNNPSEMEPTVRGVFYLPLYFQPTGRTTVLKMFKERLEHPEWEQICHKYMDKMAELKYRPQGKTIRQVIDNFAVRVDKDDTVWSTAPNTKDIVQGLIAHSGYPLTEDDVVEYEEQNSSLIESSLESCIPWWQGCYRDKFKKNRSEKIHVISSDRIEIEEENFNSKRDETTGGKSDSKHTAKE